MGGLAGPGDARFRSTQGYTVAGRIHLTQVNADAIDLHKELVGGSPLVNLVEGKLNGDFVGHHLVGTGAAGDVEGPGHFLAALSEAAKEL